MYLCSLRQSCPMSILKIWLSLFIFSSGLQCTSGKNHDDNLKFFSRSEMSPPWTSIIFFLWILMKSFCIELGLRDKNYQNLKELNFSEIFWRNTGCKRIPNRLWIARNVWKKGKLAILIIVSFDHFISRQSLFWAHKIPSNNNLFAQSVDLKVTRCHFGPSAPPLPHYYKF